MGPQRAKICNLLLLRMWSPPPPPSPLTPGSCRENRFGVKKERAVNYKIKSCFTYSAMDISWN